MTNVERLISVLGFFAFLALCYALSEDRRAVKWRVVIWGSLLQVILGAVFLSWSAGNAALRSFGDRVNDFFNLANEGNQFIFGLFSNQQAMNRLFEPVAGAGRGFLMAFQVLPSIIFFSAFMSVLYHLRIMDAVVKGIAWVMLRTMGTSGSETLSTAANIFVGQTEAPLLVKPFLERMTRSELFAIMVGGFATIAGGVFVLYARWGVDPGQMMVASVMAAPATLVVSKLLLPEREESETLGTLKIELPRDAANVVEAAANGSIDGLKLALNVAAMLIAFVGIIAVINAGLGLISPTLRLEKLIGYAFYPFAFLMGTEWQDIPLVSELLGTKIVATELVAYSRLTSPEFRDHLSPRSILLSTYALCGFANFASVAIQIGGIGALAPSRRTLLSQIAMKAMLAGALTTCLTACVAGAMA